MRTIEVKQYQYDELGDEANEFWFLESGHIA
jgi:hypothetical protein